MKLLTKELIKEWDEYTVDALGISSLDLMEDAAQQCVYWLKNRYDYQTPFIVLCGSGNNGGDGLAITRMLQEEGYAAKAFLLQTAEKLSSDCYENYKRLKVLEKTSVDRIQENTFLSEIAEHIIIIDAIVGMGINRPLEGWLHKFIHQINELPNTKIAIDIPSGLSPDGMPALPVMAVKATHTLSFQTIKRCFLHEESAKFIGQYHILDIGLQYDFLKNKSIQHHVVHKADAKKIYKARPAFSHKGNFGHAYLTGGSKAMMGAIMLASKAAMKTGLGKLTAIIPDIGYHAFQTYLPEAMCETNGDEYISEINIKDEKGVWIGMGPGMGLQEATAKAFHSFIEKHHSPMVLDADALNILSEKKEWLQHLPKDTLLTPHPKEFERLFGETQDSMQRVALAHQMALKYNIHIVLKMHHTATVTSDGEIYYNMSGNNGMATAGSGDVLLGVITGLLAQGYSAKHAAIFGVYLHGLAGDIAAEKLSEEAMLANDIIDCIGEAYKIMGS